MVIFVSRVELKKKKSESITTTMHPIYELSIKRNQKDILINIIQQPLSNENW